jgi:acyl-CoA synthetase (AMP-forming)/AMP-acid ligase II
MDGAEPSIEDLTVSLPRRHNEVMDPYIAATADRIALIEDGAKWSYQDLDKYVRRIAEHLAAFGVRAGERMMIVSENCIALAALLLAANRIDAWAIVCNPRRRCASWTRSAIIADTTNVLHFKGGGRPRIPLWRLVVNVR